MKSQVITEEIRKALWRWYQESKLTQPQMAALIKISDPAINGWLNGKSKTIRPNNWKLLFPYIKPYLPDSYSDQKDPEAIQGDYGELNGAQIEVLALMRKMSLSDQGKVLSFAAELLEKSGSVVQPEVLAK